MAPLNPFAPLYIPAALLPQIQGDPSYPPVLLTPQPYPYLPHLQPYFDPITALLPQQQFSYYVSPHSYHNHFRIKLLSLAEVVSEPCPAPLYLHPCSTTLVEQEGVNHVSDGNLVDVTVGKEEGERVDHGSCENNHRSGWKVKRSRSFGGSGRRRPLIRSRVSRNQRRLGNVELKGEEGKEKTTIMIRNVPNKLTKELLLQLLDEHCRQENINLQGGDTTMSEFDLLYLPMDFRTGNNLGYAFVNFTSTRAARRLHRYLHHKDWTSFGSHKICEITYARIQGLDALLEHFNKSVFACHSEDYLPVRFTPERDGFHQTTQHYVGKRILISEEQTAP